jgi:hypothetical protein
MQKTSLFQDSLQLQRIFDRKPDTTPGAAQGCNEYPVAPGSSTIPWEPGAKIARAPKPPTPVHDGCWPSLDPLDLSERNTSIAKGEVITMKRDAFIRDFDELVFIEDAHIARLEKEMSPPS